MRRYVSDQPIRLLMNSGFGDWLIVSSFLPDDYLHQIKTVLWCQPHKRAAFEPALRACRATQHFDHQDHDNTDSYDETVFGLWRVLDRLAYRGSPYLRQPLAPLPHQLPARYVVVQGSTPFSGALSWRDMGPDEWDPLIALLDAWGVPGVVLNVPGAYCPDHPRLIDLTGRTTVPEAVEVLKGAVGYLGIDSFLSVLAAQLFPPDRLVIRTQNPELLKRPWQFYPPHDQPTFLVPRFGDQPHRLEARQPVDPDMVVVRVKRMMFLGNGWEWLMRKEMVQVPRPIADYMVGQGIADLCGEICGQVDN